MSDNKNETDEFRKAQSVPLEKLKEKYDPAIRNRDAPTLPSTWRDPQSGKTHIGKPVNIVAPNAQDVKRFAGGRANAVCGHCKYFDLENGRKEIVRQRFGEKLVKEFEWKLRHLGGPVDSIGLCGASGGQTAVCFVSTACDQYREKRG